MYKYGIWTGYSLCKLQYILSILKSENAIWNTAQRGSTWKAGLNKYILFKTSAFLNVSASCTNVTALYNNKITHYIMRKTCILSNWIVTFTSACLYEKIQFYVLSFEAKTLSVCHIEKLQLVQVAQLIWLGKRPNYSTNHRTTFSTVSLSLISPSN